MKNIRIITIALCGSLAVVMTACNDAPYSKELESQAYVNESSTGRGVAPVTITENGASAEITVCVNKTADTPLKFKLVPDQGVLDTYNLKQSSDYVMLPDVMLNDPGVIVIPAGKYNSEPVKIGIKARPADVPSDIFAVALRLESVDGLSSVAPTTGTYVLPTVTTNIYSLPMFRNAAGGPELTADWDLINYLDGFTIEWRYQVSSFGNANYGHVVFLNHDSPDSDVYLVHWDTPSPNPDKFPIASRLQVDHKSKAGFYYQPTTLGLRTDVWNHVAVVYDGKVSRLYYNGAQVAQYESDKVGTEFGSARWFLSKSGNGTIWLNINILCTEMRIWSVPRTQTQIANNITAVSPTARGLEAYWTMTEDTYELDGTTHTWADKSGNGHTLRSTMAPNKWIDDIKSSDTKTDW